MSMTHRLFRPGKGATHARYVAAFTNGTAIYKRDLVHWDHTVPTSQGASGVIDGKTLGAADYVSVRLAAATTECGLQAGAAIGTGIDDTSGNTTALADNSLVIVQTWGPIDKVWVDSTDTAVGSNLTCAATTGEFTYIAAWASTATAAADGALAAVALTVDTADWVRGTATAEERAAAFLRCDF